MSFAPEVPVFNKTAGDNLYRNVSDVTMDDDYEMPESGTSHFHDGNEHDEGEGLSSVLLEYSDDEENNDDLSPIAGPKSRYSLPEEAASFSGRMISSANRKKNGKKILSQKKKKHSSGRKATGSSHKQNQSQQSKSEALSNSDEKNWISRMAYSFRSQSSGKSPTKANKTLIDPIIRDSDNRPHRRTGSGAMEEYPHFSGAGRNRHRSGSLQGILPPPPPYDPWNPNNKVYSSNEISPLLGTGVANFANPPHRELSFSSTNRSFATLADRDSEKLSLAVAAAFLHDYEANRPPTFGSVDVSLINDHQVNLYRWKHSFLMKFCRVSATLAIATSSFLEGCVYCDGRVPTGRFYFQRYLLTALNMFAIIVFISDVAMHRGMRGEPIAVFDHTNVMNLLNGKRRQSQKHLSQTSPEPTELGFKQDVRISRSEKLIVPLVAFCVILGVENIARFFLTPTEEIFLYSSIFKPLVLFYVSSQARDALAAVRRILNIVLRVLIMEMLLILMFAAVACRLFSNFASFASLGKSWLALFELSTTVVNPSIWLPVYEEHKSSALFFVFFIVISVFYLHSLVLSVVFQTYIQAAAEIHHRNAMDREDAVHLAFLALLQEKYHDSNEDMQEENLVDVELIRGTLRMMRPHYSTMKINALVEIMDPLSQGTVDYATFRTKIRQALNASIRTARNASKLAINAELIAVIVAFLNFVYVMLVSSPFDAKWFVDCQEEIGGFITLLAAFELLIRFNPLRIPEFTPLTRLNATFDGTALLAALISSIGVCLFAGGRSMALEFILVGRSIDIFRTLRFFQIFRDIVRRTSDVTPALGGPVILVVSTVHVFVYLGIALWGGAIEVGEHEGEIEELYDLNNFNSYHEGAVTMFQVLVVNDWHAIAEVFLLATRFESSFIVYPFFIVANLVGVSIMLNVLTAFFVESFTTKLNHDKDAPADATATMVKEKNITIEHSERPNRRVSSASKRSSVRSLSSPKTVDEIDEDNVSLSDEMFEFDVYEREGFDKIMQTVTGTAQYELDIARQVCHYLEVFESLTPDRETVGYLVCDQQTLERFGNRRFKTKAIGFLTESKLHETVSEMHAELLKLAPLSSLQLHDRSFIRTFAHRRDPMKTLEISGSLLRRNPAVSLFVDKTIVTKKASGTPPLLEDRRIV